MDLQRTSDAHRAKGDAALDAQAHDLASLSKRLQTELEVERGSNRRMREENKEHTDKGNDLAGKVHDDDSDDG